MNYGPLAQPKSQTGAAVLPGSASFEGTLAAPGSIDHVDS